MMQKYLLIFILFLAAFLLYYHLSSLMQFIGDYGWFYLSARDMLLTGKIPLVGITSSQIWLHQGPYWTYLLGVALWFGKFNPISGAYLTAFLGVIAVGVAYFVGKEMFSTRVGLIAALLYGTSPLIILFARAPYHTSFISLFTLLFIYALYRWMNGTIFYFPITICLLCILYNFELATVLLGFVLIPVVGWGIIKKKAWMKSLWNVKIILLAFIAFVLPMFPILIYDVNHSFIQTAKYANWVITYRILKPLLFEHHSVITGGTLQSMHFALDKWSQILFISSSFFSDFLLFFIFSFMAILFLISLRHHTISLSLGILMLYFLVVTLGFIFNQTPSDAYLPLFFPGVIFLASLCFDQLFSYSLLKIPILVLITFIAITNSYSLTTHDYFIGRGKPYGLSLDERKDMAKKIIQKTEGKTYQLHGEGAGSQFPSLTMNYEYLLWWMGKPPVTKHAEIQVGINEEKGGEISFKTYEF